MAADAEPDRLDGWGPYGTLLEELLSEPGVEDLRFAFVYGADSLDIAYLREDLLAEDLLPQVSELRERAKKFEGLPVTETRDDYGDTEMAVVVREQAVELYFIGGDDTGLVATADRTADVVEHLLSV